MNSELGKVEIWMEVSKPQYHNGNLSAVESLVSVSSHRKLVLERLTRYIIFPAEELR